MDLQTLIELPVDRCSQQQLEEAVYWVRSAPRPERSKAIDVAITLQNIASRHYEEHRFAQAADAVLLGLEWCGDHSSQAKMALATSAGSYLLELREFDRSIAMQRLALETATAVEYDTVIPVIAFNLGNTLRHAGRLDEAVEALRFARSRCGVLGVKEDRTRLQLGDDPQAYVAAKIDIELAEVLRIQGAQEEALGLYKEAARSAAMREHGQQYLEAQKGVVRALCELDRNAEAIAAAEELNHRCLEPTLANNEDISGVAEDLTTVNGLRLEAHIALGQNDEAERVLSSLGLLIDKRSDRDVDLLARYWGWHAQWASRLESSARLDACQKSLGYARRRVPPDHDLERHLTLVTVFALTDEKLREDAISLMREALEREAYADAGRERLILEANLAARLLDGTESDEGVSLGRRCLDDFLKDPKGNEEEVASMTLALATSPQRGAFADVVDLLHRSKAALLPLTGMDATRAVLSLDEKLLDLYNMSAMTKREPEEAARVGELQDEIRALKETLGQRDHFEVVEWECERGGLTAAERLLIESAENVTVPDTARFLSATMTLIRKHQNNGDTTSATRVAETAATQLFRFDRIAESGELLSVLLAAGRGGLARDLARRMCKDLNDVVPESVWQAHRRVADACGPDHAAEAIAEFDAALANPEGASDQDLLVMNLARRRRYRTLIQAAIDHETPVEAWRLAEEMLNERLSVESVLSDASAFFGPWYNQASIICYYALHGSLLIAAFRPAERRLRVFMIDAAGPSQSVAGLYDQAFNELLSVIHELDRLSSETAKSGWSAAAKAECQTLLSRQNALLGRPEILRHLGDLHDKLIGDIADDFDSGRLVALRLDSFLSAVPFNALYDAERGVYLIEHGPDLFLLPSLAYMHTAVARRRPSLVRSGVLVAPELELLEARYHGARSRPSGKAPAARAEPIDEIRAVTDFGEITRLIGADARLANLARAIESAGFVHFVSHGATSFQDPARAGLLLAGGDRFRSDFLRAQTCPNLWLIVLGSCYGASGRDGSSGEPVTSLAFDLATECVSSVIGSLWFLGNDATSFMMAQFYQGLGDALVPDAHPNLAALHRNAVLATRERFPEIFHWGLVYLVGDFCPTILDAGETYAVPSRLAAAAMSSALEGRSRESDDEKPYKPPTPQIEELYALITQHMANMTGKDAKAMLEGGLTPWVDQFLSIQRRILTIDPDDVSALNNLSQIGARAGFVEEGIRAARRLVELDPSAWHLATLGRILVRADQFEEGIAMLERSRALEPTFDALLDLSVAKASIGHLQEALECVEAAMRFEGTNAERAIDLRRQILAALDRVHGEDS